MMGRVNEKGRKTIAFAGNPNVGKSTLFNALTGMKQHTGNWAGKTVDNATGTCETEKYLYTFVDIPGTYSLMAHSKEEEVARNFICFEDIDAVVVVCDATSLERNLNLALQTMEICDRVLVCVNLYDEAKRKNININLEKLSEILKVPVVSTVALDKKSADNFLCVLDNTMEGNFSPYKVKYCDMVENAVNEVSGVIEKINIGKLSARWLALKLLEEDENLIKEVNTYLGEDISKSAEIVSVIESVKKRLLDEGVDKERFKDMVVSALVLTAEGICNDTVFYETKSTDITDRKIDKILTGKKYGYPLMILLLVFVLWITINGANYISDVLSEVLFGFQDKLTEIFYSLGAPQWLHGVVVLGMYRVLAWVVSVMLPPMAIFFPLFTLLEDVGYLPRIAYNLDAAFKKCHACGKQALTMCMGFGCNAVGVTGCRIIDSPRERVLAIITNSFVPCNGRFPIIISMITMFIVGFRKGVKESVVSAVLLAGVIMLGVTVTFAVTWILSKTIFKGMPSSFTLELPPYRMPRVGKVIVRSVFDRTLHVLGRAVCVAAPAGILLWIMANVSIEGVSILNRCANFLTPFARLMGMDGVILMAFILAFPANEIIIPIIIMAYMSQGSIVNVTDLAFIRELFISNGWTLKTAVSVILFSLMHWPCSTTLITVKKETGSIPFTALAFALPTVVGVFVCIIFNLIVNLLLI